MAAGAPGRGSAGSGGVGDELGGLDGEVVDDGGRRGRGLGRLPRLVRGRATTAQLGVLYPFQAGPSLGPHGIYIGDDYLAGGGAFCFDPFDAYQRNIISSPNMLIMGQLGYGKSAFVKTFLYRSVGLLAGRNSQPRRAAILDPKGEYGPLAETLGLDVVKLYPGGPVRLNPLDAGPLGGMAGSGGAGGSVGRGTGSVGEGGSVGMAGAVPAGVEELCERRLGLLLALASDVASRGGRVLTPLERSVLSWVVQILTGDGSSGAASSVSFGGVVRGPVLRDVVDLLASPTDELCARAARTAGQFVRDTEDLRYSLIELLEGPLRGMFDAQSNVSIDWNGRGVVIDLSIVKDNPDALSVVMIAASSWLDAVLTAGAATGNGTVWYQVLDEGWALISSPERVANFQSKQKLARAYGIVNMLIIHRVSDLAAQADDGSRAAKIGAGLLADSQTRVLFHQDPDQAGTTSDVLGLNDVERAYLQTLPKGMALWKVGNHSALVQGRITANEWEFAGTDSSMRA